MCLGGEFGVFFFLLFSPARIFRLILMSAIVTESEAKVDQDGSQDKDAEDGGAEAIIVRTGQSLSDPVSAPVEGGEGVDHDDHGDECEDAGRDTTDPVTKVQETDGQGSQEDREVEPGEKSTFVGKENLGFDPDWESNTLSGCGLQQRLRCGGGHGGCVNVS